MPSRQRTWSSRRRLSLARPSPRSCSWTYRGNVRLVQSGFMPPAAVQGMPWAQGRVSWGVGTTMVHGRRTYVQVDYRRHEWYATSALGFAPNGCATAAGRERTAPGTGRPTSARRCPAGCSRSRGTPRSTARRPSSSPARRRNRISGASCRMARAAARSAGCDPVREPEDIPPGSVIWNNRTHYRDGRPLDGTVRQDITALPPTPATSPRRT